MAMLMDRLNDAQKEAVTCIDQPLRIIAGAGSGKTSVLMARIEYLIKEADVYPNKIMAITFTNKAAQEMKDRLEKACPVEGTRVRISTIHALCARILREDARAAGYPKNFTILDGDDQRTLVRRLLKDRGLSAKDYPPGQVLAMISNNKMQDVLPEKARELAYGAGQRDLANLYEDYLKELTAMKAMDFDDLLLNTDSLLRTDADVRAKWHRRLEYVHVDEFQDVDPVQYSIVRSLVGPDAVLAVVGDPDQTIYTWRGASVSIILDFERDFPNARTIILDQNYRSAQPILDASNELIANNKNRVKKDLFSTRKGSTPVILYQAAEDEDEGRFAGLMIRRLHSQGDKEPGQKEKKTFRYGDFAVLYRANYQSRAFEKTLVNLKIPYRLLGGVRFFERKEIKDVLAYMNLLRKPDPDDPLFRSQDIYLERIINVPSRKIGEKFIEQLRQESRRRHMSELAVLRDPQTVSKAKAKAFTDVLDAIEADYARDGLEGLVSSILERSGYDNLLANDENEEREENVEEFMRDIEASLDENPDLTLDEYLENLALFTSKEEDQKIDAVTLMTVHAAKGTEFPVVFVGGLNEDVFPSVRALMEDPKEGLEEERRLMYVAMTRAKDLLFLMWNQGYSYKTHMSKTPSRFLMEIPDDHTATMRSAGPVPKESDAAKEEREMEENKASVRKTQELDEKKVKAARNFRERATAKARARKKVETFQNGDRVVHAVFGEGTVLNASGSVLEIQFDLQDRTKKIAASFVTRV